ncbi:hypothetical protein AVEN_251942-1, partial [Araneus ventricosus]
MSPTRKEAPRKVPPLENEFLNDQRILRAVIIRGRDALESEKLMKRSKRKERSLHSDLNRSLQPTKTPSLRHEGNVIESDSMSQNSSDESVYCRKIFSPGE